jgi:hypothetical protein
LHDGRTIIPGLLIFLGLATLPIWYTLAHGSHGEVPKLARAVTGEHCVESKENMRANHMQLLDVWRDSAVREGKRWYVSHDFPGRTYEMSLTKTCLRCHADRAQFCDRCHSTLSVAPSCWECHDATPRIALGH